MVNVQHQWTARVIWAAQSDFSREFHERLMHAPFRHAHTSLGDKEAQSLRIRAQAIRLQGVELQGAYCPGMVWHESGLGELDAVDRQHTVFEIDMFIVEVQWLIGAQAGWWALAFSYR